MGEWTRSSLETKVTVLAAQLEGRAFVEAIGEFAATLSDEEIDVLREILLARAKHEGAYEYALKRRIDEPRQKLFRRRGRRPHEPGRGK